MPHPLYDSPVASAQVKSCDAAGWSLRGGTDLRDRACPLPEMHTELHALRQFGAEITSRERTATVTGHPQASSGSKSSIPGDISSAAYFIAAGLHHVQIATSTSGTCNTNPTRAGILTRQPHDGCGADRSTPWNNQTASSSGEEVCDIHVVSSDLHGTHDRQGT